MRNLIVNNESVYVVLENSIVRCELNAENDIIHKKLDSVDTCIQCCCVSECNEYFAVCFNKELTVYNVSTWKLLCSCKIERNSVSVKFFPSLKYIMVAGKSGSVSFIKFTNNSLEPIKELALAHMSMLTDAVISSDEKYIITCDRDEKIRVTHFPNVYNIQSYCLGHHKFVTCLNILPLNSKVLVSASGDGSVRFWDYVNGKIVGQFAKNVDTDPVPVVRISCTSQSHEESLVSVQYYQLSDITVLQVKGNLESGLNIVNKETLSLMSVVFDVGFVKASLIVFLADEIKVWNSDQVTTNKVEKLSKFVLAEFSEELKSGSVHDDLIQVLHKREIDEVKYYVTQKELRLSKKSKCDKNNL